MPCFKCGYQGHFPGECMSFNGDYSANFHLNQHNEQIPFDHNGFQRCYRCNEFGHIARDCSSNTDIRMCRGRERI
jgi:hypothetical protein